MHDDHLGELVGFQPFGDVESYFVPRLFEHCHVPSISRAVVGLHEVMVQEHNIPRTFITKRSSGLICSVDVLHVMLEEMELEGFMPSEVVVKD